MSKTNCLFCQIVSGQNPCYQVYEDQDFLAFLDIFPCNLGHILVVPKKHYRWVWQVEKPAQYWSVAHKLAQVLMTTLKPLTIIFVTAGFEIPHAHIHVIPRFKDDGHGSFLLFGNKKNISPAQMKQISDKIRNTLKRGGV